MSGQTIRWAVTSLGVRDGRLHASVHVSPRLLGGLAEDTLAAFPDWLDWPATRLAFTAQAGGASVEAREVGLAPRSELWLTLFGPTTRVVSHGRGVNPLANRIIRPLPTRIDGRVASGPTAQAEPGRPAPPRLDFHTMVGALGEYPDLLRELGLLRELALPADADLTTLRTAWAPRTDTTDVWHITPSNTDAG